MAGIIGLIAMISSNCKSGKPVQSPGVKADSMIFIGYKITKTDRDIKADLLWMQKVAGSVRMDEQSDPQQYEIRVTLSDESNKKIAEVYLKDVLRKNVEFVNDQGEFERKTIYPDSTEFVVRMPCPSKVKKARLFVKNEEGRFIRIHETKIKNFEY
ncbi:MAG: hypothetical protein J5I59_07165 [Saprospiraceae bacterium]|nr:hypothetical protein [Saprospiraceae bacterium]